MKIVFAYNAWADYAVDYHLRIVKWGKEKGFDVVPFCLTPMSPKPRYSFKKLDSMWCGRDKNLLQMKKDLMESIEGADVFWLYNGGNFHPAWLNEMSDSLLRVYGCYDDPESSDDLSKPVAPYFDAVLVGNISAIPLYQSWGVKHIEWGPIFINEDPPSDITEGEILEGERPIDIVFFGERESIYRRERLDAFHHAFPNTLFYGRGWPNGYIDDEQRKKIYRQSKIGINIHNSTGPMNVRLFALPAYGIMQVCDNKCRLGHIFSLSEEVVGFDNISECINLVHYYLNNDDRRRQIALQGHKRFVQSYHPEKLWKYYSILFEKWIDLKKNNKLVAKPYASLTNKMKCINGLKKIKKGIEYRLGVRVELVGRMDKERPSALGYHQMVDPMMVPYLENPRKVQKIGKKR